MKTDILIKEAIDIIGNATPLNFNCGALCQRACCVSDGFMMVFPNEKPMLEKANYTFDRANLLTYGNIDIVTCDGTCNRDNRPFSCRIYPLAPKFVDDQLFVRLDVRGRPTCPLCHKSISSLNKDFIDKVKKALIHLCQDEEMNNFLKAISNHVDMYSVPFI